MFYLQTIRGSVPQLQLIANYFYFKSVSEGVASYSVLAYQYEWHMMEVAIAVTHDQPEI